MQLQSGLIGYEFTLEGLDEEIYSIINSDSETSGSILEGEVRNNIEVGYVYLLSLKYTNTHFIVEIELVEDSEDLNEIVVRVKDVYIV